jgi:hypothetical protein
MQSLGKHLGHFLGWVKWLFTWVKWASPVLSLIISGAALYFAYGSKETAQRANVKADSANSISRKANVKADTANAISRRANRRQRKLNKPAIEVDFRESLPARYRYRTGWLLSVRGGPATIEWVELKVDGITTGTWKAALDSLPIDPDPNSWIRHVPSDGDQFDSGDEVVLFAVDKQLKSLLSSYRRRVKLSVCYRSVFGEHWVESTNAPPRPKDSCSSPPDAVLRSARPEPKLKLGPNTIESGSKLEFKLSNEYGEPYYDPDLNVRYFETGPPPEFGRVQLAVLPRDEEGYPAPIHFSTPGKYYFVAEVYSEESDFVHHVLPCSVKVKRKQR